jgi:alkylation response protein AidB-like acyl-CoA dehydrogenase
VLEDCRIPAGQLVGEEGKGFDIAKRCLSEGRTMLSARSVGAGQKAMELAIEHGEARHTFGSRSSTIRRSRSGSHR